MAGKEKNIHSPTHDTRLKEPELTGENIIHVTTEFASARAGGLGVVVNDIVKMQALAGNNVSVVVPFFQTDDLTPAYEFLSATAQKSIKRISIEYKDNTVEADIYSFKYPIDDTHFVNVQAIRPIGDYSYLTTIASKSNPYNLSDSSIKQAINIWSEQSDIILGKKDKILSNLRRLNELNFKIRECHTQAQQLMQEEIDYHSKGKARIKTLSSLSNYEQKRNFIQRIMENRKMRLSLLKNIKEESRSLELEKSSLLSETIIPGYTLDGILFKIVNEKTHILSKLNAEYLEQHIADSALSKEAVDYIHLHHFGEEAKRLSEFFEENLHMPRAAIIKSLHSLDVKLTHLDGRSHPIKEGISHADALHLVSKGSLVELQRSADPSNHFKVYEEDAIDFSRVAVAQNGIDYNKFSIEHLWSQTCKMYGSPSNKLSDINFEVLSIAERKQLFKHVLSYILRPENIPESLARKKWVEYYDPDKPLILFVGRLSKEKGYHRLEQAALTARKNGATLAIMGYGDPIFEAEIISKFPEVIFLNSPESQKELSPLIRGAADISLLTSNRETAGLVLLEAQATGASVVSSDLPGPVSLSNPETVTTFEICRNSIDKHDDPTFNEESTSHNLSECLTNAINSFKVASQEDLSLIYESNIGYSQSHSMHAANIELSKLYAFARQKIDEDLEVYYLSSIFAPRPSFLAAMDPETSKLAVQNTIDRHLAEIFRFAEEESIFTGKKPEKIFYDTLFEFFFKESKAPAAIQLELLLLQEYLNKLNSKDKVFASDYVVAICSKMLQHASLGLEDVTIPVNHNSSLTTIKVK